MAIDARPQVIRPVIAPTLTAVVIAVIQRLAHVHSMMYCRQRRCLMTGCAVHCLGPVRRQISRKIETIDIMYILTMAHLHAPNLIVVFYIASMAADTQFEFSHVVSSPVWIE